MITTVFLTLILGLCATTHASRKTTRVSKMNTKTLHKSICVTATTKTNKRIGKTSIKFNFLTTEESASQRKMDQEQDDRQQNDDGRNEGRYCVPEVRCGLVYFPSWSEDLLEYLLESDLYRSVVADNNIEIAVGSRGRLAKALVSESVPGHRRRSQHLPLAYLLRRVKNVRPSAGESYEKKRQDQIMREQGVEPPKAKPVMLDPQELLEQVVAPLRGLEPSSSTLDDRLEMLIGEINSYCGTRYRSKRQILSNELVSEIYADKDDPSHKFEKQFAVSLLKQGASVDIRDINGQTPLMLAAAAGDYVSVNRLMMMGATLNLKDAEDRTALHYACASMELDLRIVQDLAVACKITYGKEKKNLQLSIGQQHGNRTEDGNSGSHNNDVQEDSCVHIRDSAGRTPLTVALDQMAKVFYYHRSQPNDYVLAAQMLIEMGADVNTFNYFLQTPLMLASKRKLYHIVEFLLENGANVELEDIAGCTALCHAIEWYSWTVTISSRMAKISSKTYKDDVHEMLELHAFDGIEKECEQLLLTNVYGSVDSFKAEVVGAKVTKALLDCKFLDRTFHLLIQKGRASFDVKDARGHTPLHLLHPLMVDSMYEIINPRQKEEIKQISTHTNDDGLTWKESIRWVHGGASSGSSMNQRSSVELDHTGTTMSGSVVDDDDGGGGGDDDDDKNEKVESSSATDCDFDAITWEELMSLTSTKKRTSFEQHYVRWNKPVLILNFTQHSNWNQLKETWSNEEWITTMYGRQQIGKFLSCLLLSSYLCACA
jgi:hypothetical protein